MEYLSEKNSLTPQIEDGALEHICMACGGDVRKAMNAVELLFSAGRTDGKMVQITMPDALAVSQRSAMRYDKDGDEHYDLVSALQKSVRGSDPGFLFQKRRGMEAIKTPAENRPKTDRRLRKSIWIAVSS